MSKAGCPYDNAPMERFYNTFKSNFYNVTSFSNVEMMDELTAKYINRYNALFTLQREFMGMDSQEILLLIMKRLRKRVCYFFIRQIRKEALFKLAIA